MEYPQPTLYQGQVHGPVAQRGKEHQHFIEERRFHQCRTRFNANAISVHVVIHNEKIRLASRGMPLILGFFVRI
jgi:hypothetical protein